MPDRVAIVGVGHTQFRATSPGVSYKEIMFEAATKAYVDADLDPRRDIDNFVCCSEDLSEGTSIFDEYVPDQTGACPPARAHHQRRRPSGASRRPHADPHRRR